LVIHRLDFQSKPVIIRMVYEFLEKQIPLYFQQLSLLIQDICGSQHCVHPAECTLIGRTENDRAGVKDKKKKPEPSLAVGARILLQTPKGNQVIT
jgi:hypothetical protein